MSPGRRELLAGLLVTVAALYDSTGAALPALKEFGHK